MGSSDKAPPKRRGDGWFIFVLVKRTYVGDNCGFYEPCS